MSSTTGQKVVWNGVEYSATELPLFYKPHTITALLLSLGLLICAGWLQVSPTDAEGAEVSLTDVEVPRVFAGLAAASAAFLVYSMLQFPDGIFVRPHPGLWRAVLGASLLYLMFLVFMFFLPVSQARGLLTAFDPSLGSPLVLPLYTEDCSLTWENVGPKMDIFVVAHFGGWFVKALMLRDPAICLTLSLLWEFVELSLVTMLPNFGECWWDQLIMDFLVCNTGGMILGLMLASQLEMANYNWVGFGAIASVKGKVKRAALQFTPRSWTVVQWEIFSSFRRLGSVALIIAAITLVELNAFVLKAVLWIPSSNWLNLARLALWVAMGAPALREYYQFIADPTCKKLGTQAWVACACMLVETAISIKFGAVYFADVDVLVPTNVMALWAYAILAFLIFYAYIYSSHDRSLDPSQLRHVIRPRPTISINKLD